MVTVPVCAGAGDEGDKLADFSGSKRGIGLTVHFVRDAADHRACAGGIVPHVSAAAIAGGPAAGSTTPTVKRTGKALGLAGCARRVNKAVPGAASGQSVPDRAYR